MKLTLDGAKEVLGLQSSSGAAKNPPMKHSKPTSKATPEPPRPKRRLSAAGRKATIAATKGTPGIPLKVAAPV